MRRAGHPGVGIVVVSGMCLAAHYAQQPATSSASTPIDVSKLGSQVGERVPVSRCRIRTGTFSLPSGAATIKRYGILNTTVPETNQQTYGIPFPGTFMLNPKGVGFH
jgi:hypothetical protein